MYHTKIFFICLLLQCGSVFYLSAQKNEIWLSAGYSEADLHWSIAGNANGKDPDILSELIWHRLRGPLWSAGSRYYFNNKWGVELNGGYHAVKKGRVIDRDYADDDRQNNYYNEQFNSGGKELLLDVAVNYNAGKLSGFTIRPFIGYTLQKQEALIIGDGANEAGLHSSYNTTWMGAQAGVDASGAFEQFDIRLGCSGGLLNYRATALWNLIEEFAKPVSFRHNTGGYQLKGRVEMGYSLKQKIRVMAYYQLMHADAWNGTDKAYYTDGRTVETRLNWVTTTSTGFGAGLGYLF
ncbi:hypothetical protein [Niabella beijingensis]|uniref:hypothetical protein n=1 Tax=Niabella beijingensis TaxID=2872700 RepID=UPI001CBCAABA|nr:hypothetical protein [Niabella beijingensis]MBZ4188765.1 hypothetical protein [Niabella beijingensis]